MAYFCAVSAKQKLIQNIEISVIRKNFSSAQRNLFFDSVCGLSGQFVDSTVLILKIRGLPNSFFAEQVLA